MELKTNGHFLCTKDGAPFFYLADTAWELFHKLSREEISDYLDQRAAQGFNAIQCVALAELDGLRTPNFYGRIPLLEENPLTPDLTGPYSYWDHVDWAVREMNKRGMIAALLPTWGDKFHIWRGKGPEVFTPENAYQYGEFIARRYQNQDIIWVLGGDRELNTYKHYQIIDAMARAIQKNCPHQLITFHPFGGSSSSSMYQGEKWLDFNMIQSGHHCDYEAASRLCGEDYEKEPVKPVVNGEPAYEDHPVDFQSCNGFYTAHEVRTRIYSSIFAGACGVAYGHHSIWRFQMEPHGYTPLTWRQALKAPGAGQIRYLKQLLLKLDYFSRRPAPRLLEEAHQGKARVMACEGTGYALFYDPMGLPFQIRWELIPEEYSWQGWFNPEDGSIVPGREVREEKVFPPNINHVQDWVLILAEAPLSELTFKN